MDTSRMSDAEREAYWRRREDARTLAEAERIKADKNRLQEAKRGAREILDDENTRLNGLAKVAGRKVEKVTPDPKKDEDPRIPVPVTGRSYRSGNALPDGIPGVDVFKR